jgi:hypothetical protein
VAWENLTDDVQAEFAGLVTLDVRGLSRHADMGFNIQVRYQEYHARWAREDRRLNPGKYRQKHQRFGVKLREDPARYARRLEREAAYRATKPPVTATMRVERPDAYAARLAKNRAYMVEYNQRPERRAVERARQKTPEYRAAEKLRNKEKYQRLKADPVRWAKALERSRRAKQRKKGVGCGVAEPS